MSRRHSYRVAAAFGALSFSSLAVTSLISSIVVGRIYGVDVIGEWALAMAPVNAVWFLSSFRERPSLIRELAMLPARSPRVTGLWAAVFAASFALTVVVGGAGFVIAAALFRGPIHQPEVVGPAALAMAGYVFITNTTFNLDTIFAGFRAGRALHWIRLHQAVAFLLLAVGLGLWVDRSAWTLVAAGVLSYATSLVHRVIAIRPMMRFRVPLRTLREGFGTLPGILRFGFKIMPGGIADGVSNESGTWVLALTGSVAGVGAYNRAYTLSRRFVELNWRVNEMLFPTLIERRATGDHDGFDRALVDSLRYAAGVMLLPAAVVGGAAVGVMRLFGPGFDTAAGALAVLAAVPALATLSNMQRHTLYAVDKPLQSTASALLRMSVTVATTIGLTLWLGTTGTALGVVLGYLADLVFMAHRTRLHIASLPALMGVRHALAIPAGYLAGFAVSRALWTAWPTTVGMLVALAAGAVAYVGAFLAVGGLHDRDRERLGAIARAVRSRMEARAAAPAGS